MSENNINTIIKFDESNAEFTFGKVISHSPSAGDLIDDSTTVELFVSRGNKVLLTEFRGQWGEGLGPCDRFKIYYDEIGRLTCIERYWGDYYDNEFSERYSLSDLWLSDDYWKLIEHPSGIFKFSYNDDNTVVTVTHCYFSLNNEDMMTETFSVDYDELSIYGSLMSVDKNKTFLDPISPNEFYKIETDLNGDITSYKEKNSKKNIINWKFENERLKERISYFGDFEPSLMECNYDSTGNLIDLKYFFDMNDKNECRYYTFKYTADNISGDYKIIALRKLLLKYFIYDEGHFIWW